MDATVTVVAVESVGPDTVAIEFESPADFDAAPGQFVKLTGTVDGDDVSRFYTLSSPDVEGIFEITVAVDPAEDGDFSRYLANLSPGETVAMTGPFGDSYYEGEPRVVVIAGGPGIGPAVGIGERALDDDNEVAIVYRDETPAHRERLDALEAAGATVIVTDGALDDLVEDVVTGLDGEQVYVYGFADFLEEATDALEATGIDSGNVKAENFG